METTKMVCTRCGRVIDDDEFETVHSGGYHDEIAETWCIDCAEAFALKCSHCGEWYEDTAPLIDEYEVHCGRDYEPVCIHCIDEFERCEHCGAYISPDEDRYNVNSGGNVETWCEQCMQDCAVVCDHCGELIDDAYAERVHVDGGGIETWCTDCVERHALQCDDCSEYFSTLNGYYLIDEYETHDGFSATLCETCRCENWYWCESCERLIPDCDAEYIGGCVYCPSCANEHMEHDALQSYHHTRAMSFWFADGSRKYAYQLDGADLATMFMGIELETDYNDDAFSLARDIIDAIGDERVECKEDGSLHSDGVEIVSQPMHPLYHLNSSMWSDIIGIVRQHGGKSHDACTCGLHMHISRDYFKSHDAVYRLDRLVTRFRSQMVRFSRRDGGSIGSWCRIDETDKLANIADVHERKRLWASDKRYAGRYEAVNDTNGSTVEIRLWRGTLNEQTFRATIEFTAGLAIVCNTVTDEFADAVTWRELKSLVRYALVCNGMPYGEFDAYCAVRGL